MSNRCATVDPQTRDSLAAVLASLQRFDHRLELVITPVHYADIFGDNWVSVRAFVESPQGRSLPDVSAMLLEIIILYKRRRTCGGCRSTMNEYTPGGARLPAGGKYWWICLKRRRQLAVQRFQTAKSSRSQTRRPPVPSRSSAPFPRSTSCCGIISRYADWFPESFAG